MAITSAGPLSGETVCAVIPAPGPIAQAAGELLETQLGAVEGLKLVNRTDIQAVVNEQLLSAAMAEEGTQSRLKLGKLIRADLLVFLREASSQEAKGIWLTVAETRHGLRLIMEPAIWDPDQAESICKTLAAKVQRARELVGRSDLKIVAVSPFENLDLDINRERQRGYARLVEHCLAQLPDWAVVELAEARALGQEVAISGQAISRELPFYIMGSYKTINAKDAPRTNLTLELKRGNQTAGKVIRDAVPAAEIGQALQEAVAALISKTTTHEPTTRPAGVEIDILLQRAETFTLTGEYELPLTLYESVLLLDPRNPRAHYGIIRGLTQLMSRTTRDPKGGYHSMDSLERLRCSEEILNHLEILASDDLLSTKRAQWPPNLKKATIDETMRQLDGFNRSFSRIAESREPDPLIASAFSQQMQRYADILFILLDNNRFGMTSGRHEVVTCLRFLVDSQLRMGDFQASLKTLEGTFSNLRGLVKERVIAITMTHYAAVWDADKLREAATYFSSSESPSVRMAGRIADILLSIDSPASLEKAHLELEALCVAEHIDMPQVLIKAADRQFSALIPKKRTVTPERRLAQIESQMPRIAEPVLPLISLVTDDGKRVQWVHDWVACGDDEELIAADFSLYRLDSANRLVRLAAVPGQVCLSWDGRFVWANRWPEGLGLKGFCGPGPILAADLQGRWVEFNESDMPPGVGLPTGVLTVLGPGQACFIGYFRPESLAPRNYVMSLRVESQGDHALTKSAEMLWENRHSERPHIRAPRGAENWSWAATISGALPGKEPRIILGAAVWPVLFDVGSRTATEMKHWPMAPTVTQDGEWLYIGSGGIVSTGQESFVHRVRGVEDSPECLVEFGAREFLRSLFGWYPYYGSLHIVDQKLHLLAARHDFPGRTPAWTVVDLRTLQACVLKHEFDEKTWPRSWHVHKLVSSKRFGLVLLSGGMAYMVQLPPESEWTDYAEYYQVVASTIEPPRFVPRLAASRPATRPRD